MEVFDFRYLVCAAITLLGVSKFCLNYTLQPSFLRGWLAYLCKYITFFLILGIIVLLMYQAYMALNDIDAAVESFKKASDLEPNDG